MGIDGLGPSKKGYWVGAAIIAVGVLGAIVWGVLGFVSFASTVDDFQRVPANGSGEVTLGTGGHVIYYEGPGADDGVVPEGRVLVTAAGSDDAVTLSSFESELSYNDGTRAGLAVLTFDVETVGTYVIESTSDGNGELAVGRSVAGKLVSTIVGSLVLGAVGVVSGGVILIVTAVRRRKARARQDPWNAAPPGGPVYSPSPAKPAPGVYSPSPPRGGRPPPPPEPDWNPPEAPETPWPPPPPTGPPPPPTGPPPPPTGPPPPQ